MFLCWFLLKSNQFSLGPFLFLILYLSLFSKLLSLFQQVWRRDLKPSIILTLFVSQMIYFILYCFETQYEANLWSSLIGFLQTHNLSLRSRALDLRDQRFLSLLQVHPVAYLFISLILCLFLAVYCFHLLVVI